MKRTTLIILVLSGLFSAATASKPVTLTDFHAVYSYLDEVGHVLDHGLIDGRIIAFLADQNNPIDEKAAVINALVVKNNTHSNALSFKQYMARKYREKWENLDLNKLNAEELFCLGYMTILDDNGNSSNGLPILEMAEQKNPFSYTISLFRALASAERSIALGNPCEGWKTCNQVKSNTSLRNDLDASISTLIVDVMESYKNDCE
jgi:hypothetical protein